MSTETYTDPRHAAAAKPLARVEITGWAAAGANLDPQAIREALAPLGIMVD